MKISVVLNYAGNVKESITSALAMEEAGVDLLWVPEAYGFDSPSMLGCLAGLTERIEIGSAIIPIFTRTPTLIAMTAAGIDALSDGRFNLGLGVSGPQVIEGFHGVPYNAPMSRTNEVVTICRELWKREAPLTHGGKYYKLPLPSDQGTGLGKPLKLLTHPLRNDIPIWVASLGAKNVAMTAEIANGWIPFLFIPERAHEIWGDALSQGKAKRNTKLGPLQISAGGLLAIGDSNEVLAVRELARQRLALYIGGMGAKGKNFYNDIAVQYGFEREALAIQDLYLAGQKDEAAAMVPAEFLESTSLCGPACYVKERISAYQQAGVTHLQIQPVPTGDQTLRDLIGGVRNLLN